MAFISRTRLVNPRLGTYFGIFAAAFVALVIMALMVEQLGAADFVVRLLMFAGPLALYGVIAIGARAQDSYDFFACGRRVPAFFNGLVIGTAALGGTAFLALTGVLLIIGFDALCLSIGWLAGLVFMVVLFAPFLRKFGAYTLPTFLGRRFESHFLRRLAAALLSAPILLLLIAELRFAAYASAWMLGQSERLMVVLIIVYVTAIAFIGGMRALTWSSVAQGIAALLALAVPATIVALMLSNLPLPQMTHGNVLRMLTRLELARGVPVVLVPPLTVDLPSEGIEPLVKRFIQAFGSVGSMGFVLMSLVMAAGVAASPVLLPRSGTTPGVYESRKSLGWAVLVVGFVLLTLPAVAIYLRALLLDQVIGQQGDSLPIWFQLLQQAGIARVDSKTQLVGLRNVGFERDAVLFALPIAAGFPQVLIHLALVGALAASLTALGAALAAVSAIIAEDLVHRLPNETAPDNARLGTARVALLGVAFVTTWFAIVARADPLQLFLWGISLSASAIFPVLVLSIWWDRINASGAVSGMVTGFVVAALAILLSESGAITLPSVLAGVVGLPLALGAAVGVSVVTPAPNANVLDVINEMRVPGGETLYDRETRLRLLKSRASS
jgi:cation/acetate symporter